MSEEEKQIMNKMIYCNLVSGEQALKFNSHIKEILQENEQLKDRLQQKENIIKEVREYIMSELITEWDIKNAGCVSGSDLPVNAIIPILEILDKANEKENK